MLDQPVDRADERDVGQACDQQVAHDRVSFKSPDPAYAFMVNGR
jgi:hypothetical protein